MDADRSMPSHRKGAKETLQNLFAKALRATDFQRFSSSLSAQALQACMWIGMADESQVTQSACDRTQ